MKTILLTTATVTSMMIAGFWIIFDLEEATAPQQNEMRNGCVYQKTNNQWIRTCG